MPNDMNDSDHQFVYKYEVKLIYDTYINPRFVQHPGIGQTHKSLEGPSIEINYTFSNL